MVIVRRTAIRAPVYQGDGLLSWARKAGKSISKAVKSPVGQVARKIYNRTLAPVAKQALVAAVGEKAANSLENVGKRTLNGENIDTALAEETRALAKSEVKNMLGTGVRPARSARYVTKPMRTSDMIKTIRPRASTVMQRIEQEGQGLEEETTM